MKTDEEAAEWFGRIREQELSDAERRHFAAWLAESPVHVREYLDVAETWGALHSPASWSGQTREELFENIRSAKDTNVIALNKIGEAQFQMIQEDKVVGDWNARRYWPFALAASFALIAFVLIWPRLNIGSTTYMTSRGEQRSVVLADGSIVQLNTLSKMIVHFDGHRRRIELPQGEAFFRVAHDKARPFDVETPFAVVRAVGTEFNVYNRHEGMQVAVVEGRVKVASAIGHNNYLNEESSPDSIYLIHQQSVDVSAQGKIGAPHMTSDIQMATAWIQRRIALDDDRLDTAVEEFNRYNKTQMEVRDPGLADLRISGVFNADDPFALIKYLQHTQHVQVYPMEHALILQRGE